MLQVYLTSICVFVVQSNMQLSLLCKYISKVFNSCKIYFLFGLGSLHCVCCTSEGEVYTWGDNDEGQLGDSTTNAIQRPRLVMALQVLYGIVNFSESCIIQFVSNCMYLIQYSKGTDISLLTAFHEVELGNFYFHLARVPLKLTKSFDVILVCLSWSQMMPALMGLTLKAVFLHWF